MNKTKYLMIAVASAFSLVLWGGNVSSQEWTEGTVQSYYQPMGWDTFQGGWLIGHRVYSPAGGNLGQISDLMIDRTDGHIALVILSDVPGFGAQFVAVPFGALQRTGESVFELSFGDREIAIVGPYEDPYAYELRRVMGIVGLSDISTTIDLRWAETLYRSYGQAPYWTHEGREVPTDIASYRCTGLMGAEVSFQEGKDVARISDFVIDSKDGRVAFLVVDQVPGRGDMEVAVPFEALSMSGNAFALNITEERLAAAPGFRDADLSNQQKAEDVYKYFGLQPYWTEGGGAMGSTMEQPSTMEEHMMDQPMGETHYDYY
ncbi:MAG TPA: PRC-barrel domain-containing protein [Thermodesulfobacteriota bacterium]|nr:PRC-barrel domain-containing protein [Thermodesulfobacteriota bacterium]